MALTTPGLQGWSQPADALAHISVSRPIPRPFETFYASEFDRIYRAVLAFTGDPERARDATQEAFGRAFARWRRLRDEDWAAGWVMTTALNACRRERRMVQRFFAALPADLSKGEEIGERDLVTSDAAHGDLVNALRRLPRRQRQAVILHYLGDYSVAQVARLMGVSEGSVKSHLSRARRALRAGLE